MTIVITIVMINISKSQLKAKLLEILREVESDGREIIVTDRGKPVAVISKYRKSLPTDELFADLRGGLKYTEDLTEPTIDEWSDI